MLDLSLLRSVETIIFTCVFYTNLPLNITPLAGQLNDTQTSFVIEEIAVSRPVFSSDEDIGYLQGESTFITTLSSIYQYDFKYEDECQT